MNNKEILENLSCLHDMNPMNKWSIYEVNLSFNKDIFEIHGAWFMEHINDMVSLNGFSKACVYQELIVDPTDDSFLRKCNLIVQYYIKSYEKLQDYLETKSQSMRSQVVEKFGNNYTVKRRVFELVKEIII